VETVNKINANFHDLRNCPVAAAKAQVDLLNKNDFNFSE